MSHKAELHSRGWFERYHKLDDARQAVLQLFGVYYEPMTKTRLYQFIRSANLRQTDGKAYQLKDLTKVLRALVAQDLLLHKDATYSCPEGSQEELMLGALQAGRLDTFAELMAKDPAQTKKTRGSRSSAVVRLYTGAVRYETFGEAMREWRIALYQGDTDKASSIFDQMGWMFRVEYNECDPYTRWLQNIDNLGWFVSLDRDLIEKSLMFSLLRSMAGFENADEVFALLKEYAESQSNGWDSPLVNLLLDQWIVRGCFDDIRTFLSTRTHHGYGQAIEACLSMISGHMDHAELNFQRAIRTLRNEGKRKYETSISLVAGVFRTLLLLQQGNIEQAASWAKQRKEDCPGWLEGSYDQLILLGKFQQGQTQSPDKVIKRLFSKEPSYKWERWFRWFLAHWMNIDAALSYRKQLIDLQQAAQDHGYHWIEAEALEMLARLDDGERSKRYVVLAESVWEDLGGKSLLDVIVTKAPWEYTLQALMQIGQEEKIPEFTSSSEKIQRLVWTINDKNSSFELSPRIQKKGKNGRWTKGRQVALTRLMYELRTLEGITEEDRKVAHILCATSGHYFDTPYTYSSIRSINKEEALLPLVGQSNVYSASTHQRMDIAKVEPVLRVMQVQGGQLQIQLEPTFSSQVQLIITRPTATRLEIAQPSEQHRKLAEVLGEDGLTVPKEAQQSVLQAVAKVAPLISIHSDIGGSTVNTEEVEADPRIYLYLYPYRSGLRIEHAVQPFGGKGPRFLPSKGAVSVFAKLEDTTFHTHRDLDQEHVCAKALWKTCPLLTRALDVKQEWFLPEPEDCLTLLLQLNTLKEQVVLCWPEGETFKFRGQVSQESMRWNVSGNGDWFQATAELTIDETMVLNLKQLLHLLEFAPGRFLKLDNGEYLALTDEFRRRLKDFDAFATPDSTGASFHASASFAMEDVFDNAGHVDADDQWNEHIKQLHDTSQKAFPLPSDLTATLRDYQTEGYQWLSRLNSWRFGACLADEMGLGKTLQALATVLARAEAGPSLVLAPTSVCLNWGDEVEKFAPSLTVKSFANKARQKLLDSLEPYDLVVCSYGLLPFEIDKLSEVHWNVVVLDEAQAIKNVATQRSKAAMRLKSNCKLVTTGTPIENNLGELWNLFRFLNPGLLGSWKQFHQTFANPIERNQDNTAREQLKRLIQPFILRRRKQDVLTELPSRTEIELHVELSKEEKALYEALRQKAVENLEARDETTAGQRHIQILTELTKLRQACCHPRLILPESVVESSKLQLLEELVDELITNEHKVLVFSQFVKHLSLIREMLDNKGITYQYLDGSTPQKKRKQRIDAFQDGDGDVFLISLKAGGTGINLTAADYVIHMDPWWNPAVEDQASDRAHRIGQQRPVTIYRLVTQHTVEEKIVELHQSKRNLAESLLDGSDMTGKMSADELMGLIRER